MASMLGAAPIAVGQTPAENDSLRQYDLSEIVVSHGVESGEIETIQRIGLAELAALNPTSAADLGFLLPAASIQTNSRGESLIYLRNAGERQVAVFLDGAQLNVPWDNRVDLGLVPVRAIGSITVVKGASSVLLGTNVLGGAVNLVSNTAFAGQRFGEVSFSTGELGLRHITAQYFGGINSVSYGATAEFAKRNAIPLPGNAETPFNQTDADGRSNTDRKLASFHGRVSKSIGEQGQLGLTVLFSDGEKGVAPETHLNPDESTVRFWRYPNTRRVLAIANGRLVSGSTTARATVWGSGFKQDIEQFDSGDYTIARDLQQDNDVAAGLRVTGEHQIKNSILRSVFSYVAAEHEQSVSTASATATSRFRQDVFSGGIEYQTNSAGKYVWRVGGSLDGYRSPTGGPIRTSDFDFSASSGVGIRFSQTASGRIALARKVRFPTAREQQDTALGRFALNPDLGPETSLLAEAGFAYTGDKTSGEIVPFVQRTFDTIDQTRIMIDGESVRQRTNLDDSIIYGIEVTGAAKPASRLHVNGSVTGLYTRGIVGDERRRLTERPAVLGSLSVAYRLRMGFSATAELAHRGRAYSQNEENELEPLRLSTTANFRVGYLRYIPRQSVSLEAFIRADNIFDTTSEPQLGLPGAGRVIRGGVTIGIGA